MTIGKQQIEMALPSIIKNHHGIEVTQITQSDKEVQLYFGSLDLTWVLPRKTAKYIVSSGAMPPDLTPPWGETIAQQQQRERQVKNKATAADKKPGALEDDATQIGPMVWQTARGMEFRMELHRPKGGWQSQTSEFMIEGILRNLHEMYRAYRKGDKVELCNEGLDTINNIAMLINNEASEELKALTDFVPLIEEIRRQGRDDRG